MHSCAKHLQYWCCKGKWKLGNSLINLVGSSSVMIWLYNNGTLLPSLPLLLSRLVFSCQGSQKELLNLTQQDYMNRIEELNQSLKDAWSSDQKVKALKIVIQVSFTFLLVQNWWIWWCGLSDFFLGERRVSVIFLLFASVLHWNSFLSEFYDIWEQLDFQLCCLCWFWLGYVGWSSH